MRYFKYKNTNKNLNNALKEQYKTLTADEKSIVRKERFWLSLTSIFSPVIFCILCVSGIFLLKQIPRPDEFLWMVIYFAVMSLLGFFILILSGLLTFALSVPLFKKIGSFNIPEMKKEIFSKACAHLRDYYELREPYIVTKCFDSTNVNFRNHDVCIFIVDDELRITADLIQGFLYGERDLGCYAFKRDEITLNKHYDGQHLRLELKADEMVFLLGYRAKSFIDKYFI